MVVVIGNKIVVFVVLSVVARLAWPRLSSHPRQPVHPASYSVPYHILAGAKCAACLLAATWAGLNGPNWLYCVGICMCAGNGCDGI